MISLVRLTAPRIAVNIPHPQRLGIDVLESRNQIPLLLVHKCLAISHQELHVAHLGDDRSWGGKSH